MNVNGHYRPHASFLQAQARGRARELTDKFFRFAERMERDYANGFISKAKYDEFRRTSPSEHIRNYGFTWAE